MDDGKLGQDCYRFYDVEVDARSRRVLRGGTQLMLEPKAFAVLLELLRRSGSVVSRDALLDAVWGHRHVTPTVLNRIVAILRRELGDDADHPRLIRTVHGVGYMFIAALEAHADGRGAPPSVLADASATAGTSVPDGRRSRVSARNVAIAIVSLLFVAGLVAFQLRSPPVRHASLAATATKAPPSAPVLVVLPLRPVGGEHGEAVLAEALSEELTTRLSRLDGLGMISATSATIAQSREFDATQLAERLKATHALEGSLQEAGEQLRINLRLLELPAGRLVWTQAYDRPIVGFAALRNDVAAEVARALALRDTASNAVEAHDVDPVVLRRFLDLRRQIRTVGVPDWEAQLRALVAAHPDYAPAHGLLGAMLAVRTPSKTRLAEAQHEAELALQLDPDEADARITLAWFAIQDGDWERAGALYREALQRASTDPIYRAVYGMLLGSLGYLEEGLRQSELGSAYDPLGSSAAVSNQVFLLDALGRHDEARRRIDALPAAAVIYANWCNAFWRGDTARTRSIAEAMPDSIWKASYLAVTAALEDPKRWPQAHAAIEASERLAREQGNPKALNYLRWLEPQPDPVRKLALADSLLRDVFAFSTVAIWMPENRSLRQAPEFQDFLKRNGILDYWRAHGFPPRCRGDGDGARCD